MCLGAILWARIARLYYANDRADAEAIGFDDDAFYREVALPPDRRSVKMERLLAEEARAVFKAWEADPNKIRY
jgi:tRNA(Arg) A34 adenosine deaminase TadA